MSGVILSNIDSPNDLKKLSLVDLEQLSIELRKYIIDVLAQNPGHLASSLGTVELTVALHYVFNTPDDKLVWDVGHQAYAHKILTGRRDVFPTIRTFGGLSGFPRMSESQYDAFGTGHSSTSISAALGMATASKLLGDEHRQHIAIIGDGALTGGEAFEALNNAGVSRANILVVLNDNGISIDKAVGGMSRYLTRITASRKYNRLKEKVWSILDGDNEDGRRMDRHIGFIRRMLNVMKTALNGSPNMFESLGFKYYGPINGHDVVNLVEVLRKMQHIKGPKLLHIVTKKGKGMRTAEQNPITYHSPGKFNVETGAQIQGENNDTPLKYQDVFGYTIVELAEANPKIVGITPAMPTGCSLNIMMQHMPDRAFDVSIAEQHAVTFAAGLAAQGMVPFCNIYSSFMQRAYDQIVHDVALQKLPVVLCLDRAGLVGEDGPTHHGVFDLSCLRSVPNLTICAPMNEHELRNMMFTAQSEGTGPFVIRYPRGTGVCKEWRCPFQQLPIGKGRCIEEGDDLAIVTIGHSGNDALNAVSQLRGMGISAALYDMRFLKPLDVALLDQVAARFSKVITVEDGSVLGGLGGAVAEYYHSTAFSGTIPEIVMLGVPDNFVPHGSVPQLKKQCGFDTAGIVDAALALAQKATC